MEVLIVEMDETFCEGGPKTMLTMINYGTLDCLTAVVEEQKSAYAGQRLVPDQEGFSVLMKSQNMCSARLFDAE